MTEHRNAVELRLSAGRLEGVALRYGQSARDRQERFEPGAFSPAPGSVPLLLQHDPAVRIGEAAIEDHRDALRFRAAVPPGWHTVVRESSLNEASVGFRAIRESRAGETRIIERAELAEISLVNSGAYATAVEARQKNSQRWLRARVKHGINLACECAPRDCKRTRFEPGALRESVEAAQAGRRTITAVLSNYAGTLASTVRGTLRFLFGGDGEQRAAGDLVVEIALPDGDLTDRLLQQQETAGLVIRPFLDTDASEWEAVGEGEERTAVYSRAVIRSLVIGSTDRREGWDEPELFRAAPPPKQNRNLRALLI